MVQESTPQGSTPLMRAAARGDATEAERLIADGADPSARDAAGRTAADHARAGGHSSLAERLETTLDQEQTLR